MTYSSLLKDNHKHYAKLHTHVGRILLGTKHTTYINITNQDIPNNLNEQNTRPRLHERLTYCPPARS
jgi:hypothetical protein